MTLFSSDSLIERTLNNFCTRGMKIKSNFMYPIENRAEEIILFLEKSYLHESLLIGERVHCKNFTMRDFFEEFFAGFDNIILFWWNLNYF